MLIKILAAILTIALLFLIINRAFRNLKYFNRSVINLGLTVVLGGVIYLAYYFDLKNKMYLAPVYYLTMFFSVVGVGLTFFVFLIIKVLTNKTFVRGKIIKEEKVNKYLYIVYTKGLDVYLLNGRGIIKKIGKNYLYDELINEVNKEYGIVTSSDYIKRIGEVTISDKVNTIYYCYLVKVFDEVDSKLEKIDKRALTSYDFKYLDKQIIFRTLLEEEFVIKIDKKDIGD